MIELARRDGRPLVIGHRGAVAVAPENTIAGFEAARSLGVDLVELDVLALESGTLVVAHSDRLDEITHGAARGRVGALTLAELRDLAPALPTFAEALDWFAGAPGLGLQVDLKTRLHARAVASALESHGLAARTVVSSPHAQDLEAVRRVSARVRLGLTYPNDRYEVSRRRSLRPVVQAGLTGLRISLPPRVPRLLDGGTATALMLQQRLVSRSAVRRAHALGAAVVAWTVDAVPDIERVVAAGVDAVTTNDPLTLLATLRA